MNKLSKAQQEVIDALNANPSWRICVQDHEWKDKTYFKYEVDGVVMGDFSGTTFNSLQKRGALVADGHAWKKRFYVLAPEYRVPADEPTADIGTMETDTVAARAIAAAEDAPAPFAVGDRVEVTSDGFWATGKQGTVIDPRPERSEVLVQIDDEPVKTWFMTHELRKLDATPTPDPRDAEIARLTELLAQRDTLIEVALEVTKKTHVERAAEQAEIARLKAEIERLNVNTGMTIQGLADVFNENGRIYAWELGAVQNVRNALNLNREVIHELRDLLKLVDSHAPFNTSEIEGDGFRWAIDDVREYIYTHNLG